MNLNNEYENFNFSNVGGSSLCALGSCTSSLQDCWVTMIYIPYLSVGQSGRGYEGEGFHIFLVSRNIFFILLSSFFMSYFIIILLGHILNIYVLNFSISKIRFLGLKEESNVLIRALLLLDRMPNYWPSHLNKPPFHEQERFKY